MIADVGTAEERCLPGRSKCGCASQCRSRLLNIEMRRSFITAAVVVVSGLGAMASAPLVAVAQPQARGRTTAAARRRDAPTRDRSARKPCSSKIPRRNRKPKATSEHIAAGHCRDKAAKHSAKSGVAGHLRGAPASPSLPGASASKPTPSGGTPDPPTNPVESKEPGGEVSPSLSPFRFFAASSFWNEALAADAPLDPGSGELVDALNAEVTRELEATSGPQPAIDTIAYSTPIYTVPANEATVPVSLNNTPKPALTAAWSEVPLPANAQPAAGTDGDLIVWQPATDRMWEFWRLTHNNSGWSASWGGAMQHVSKNRGVYGPEAWPGATPWWGVTASSLALAGGLISLEDLADGQINHALAMSIPNVRTNTYASPAQRTDGTSASPLALPEGAHLRLAPNLNLNNLHLPHITLEIAQAAQRYGIYIRDSSPNIGFYAQDPTPTGTNPYTGPHGYYEGKAPAQLLASFPWQHLQLLKMSLHNNE